MTLSRPVMISLVLVAATIAVGVWGYATLPAGATIPINYTGLDGLRHAHMAKGPGLALIPAISALVLVSVIASTSIVLRRRRLAGTVEVRGLLITSLAGLFLVIESALVAQAADPHFDAFRWIFLAAAVLLLLVGNALGKLRHNFVLGVRTHWTLSDPRVWDKTHRFTGRLMVIGALALAAVAGFLPNHALLIGVLVLAAAGPMIAGALYSARIAAPLA
jgi:uncharacterized membrane protein